MDKYNFNDAIGQFRNVINTLQPLPETDFELLTNVLKFKKLKKGDIVLKEDKVCRHIWFICKGCFRIFSVENGVEKNVNFFFENQIASDFVSLRHGIPTHFNIEAMEDCVVLAAHKQDYTPVLNFSKYTLQLTSSFFQQSYFRELEHSNSFKLMNPEERYHYLQDSYPKYLQRIPLTYLASYLGMSRKTLSRIRSNIQ